VRFLVDAQLPPALAQWIELQGCGAEHVAFALTPTARDAAIVKYAVEYGAAIVTKDSDFLILAPPPPLVLVTTGNISNRALLELFQDRFSSVITAIASGQGVVEVG
jgi:predicted nuclease of predicted toxin-antitoxin system